MLRTPAVLSLIFLVLTLQACRQQNVDELTRLGDALARPEFQGGSDGWGAARRRRLLTQYFAEKGLTVETVSESRSALNPHDKYRKVHLLVGPPAEAGSKTTHITYVLDASGQRQDAAAQADCDRLLLRQLATVRQKVRTNLRFGMDNNCLTRAAD